MSLWCHIASSPLSLPYANCIESYGFVVISGRINCTMPKRIKKGRSQPVPVKPLDVKTSAVVRNALTKNVTKDMLRNKEALKDIAAKAALKGLLDEMQDVTRHHAKIVDFMIALDSDFVDVKKNDRQKWLDHLAKSPVDKPEGNYAVDLEFVKKVFTESRRDVILDSVRILIVGWKFMNPVSAVPAEASQFVESKPITDFKDMFFFDNLNLQSNKHNP